MVEKFLSFIRTNELIILRFLLLMIAIFVVSNFFGTYIKSVINPPEDTGSSYTSKTKETILPFEHSIRKNPESNITFIEYIDLECPHCKKLHILVKELLASDSFTANYIIRHFPLVDIHEHAKEKARIAECVSLLSGEEKFFAFIDEYFTKHEVNLSIPEFKTLASTYTQGTENLTTCMSGQEVTERVNESIKLGLYSGVFSTPTLIVLKDGVFEARYDLLTDLSGASIMRDVLRGSK